MNPFKLPDGQAMANAEQFEQMAVVMADPASNAVYSRADIVARLRDAATACRMLDRASEMHVEAIVTGNALNKSDGAAMVSDIIVRLTRLALADNSVMEAANKVHAFAGQADSDLFKRRLAGAVESILPNIMGIDDDGDDILRNAKAGS